MKRLKRLTESAVLLAVALIIFRVEAAIPLPIAIPGIKLGLANIVTLFSLFLLPKYWVYAILLLRVILGGIIIGNPMAILYGLAGGTISYLITVLFLPIVTNQQIWALGILGAIAHNIGQILVAILLTHSLAILGYLPFLLLAALFSGTLTGRTVELLITRFSRIPELQKQLIIKKD